MHKPNTPARPATTTSQRKKRPFYADRADRLRARSPKLYGALRGLKRSLGRSLPRKSVLAAGLLLALALAVAGLIAGGTLRLVLLAAGAGLLVAGGALALAAFNYNLLQRARATRRRVDQQRLELSATTTRLETRLASLESDLAKQDVDGAARRAVAADAAERESRMNELTTSIAALRAELARVATTVGDAPSELRAAVERLDADSRDRVGALQERIETQEATTSRRLSELAASVDGRVVFSNYSNASRVRLHERRLTDHDLERFRDHWLRVLGLSMTDRQLLYLAHKICLEEDRCEGRLATTIQAAMLRVLAMLSVRSEQMEMLEIGTLAGVSAGNLHCAGRRVGSNVRLTLIDPLTGYYGQSALDGQTGVAITRATLESNLAALAIEPENYRIIQRLSTDPAAVSETSDRKYDLVVIDGDHSLAGVSNDFELYRNHVRPGGLLIFDDYDTTDWPAIKPFVDDEVRPLDEWLWIGGEWRTAILQRKLGDRK